MQWDGVMSWFVWVGVAYFAGLLSAFVVFALLNSGDRKAAEDLEARELAALKAHRRTH